jgi:hypothetical protein
MPEFKFFIDQKTSQWRRETYTITAQNQQLATIIMKSLLHNEREVEKYLVPDSDIVIEGTEQDMCPDDYGRPSRELYSLDEKGNDTFIEGNGDSKHERR